MALLFVFGTSSSKTGRVVLIVRGYVMLRVADPCWQSVGVASPSYCLQSTAFDAMVYQACSSDTTSWSVTIPQGIMIHMHSGISQMCST
jgi:hypothetical protein